MRYGLDDRALGALARLEPLAPDEGRGGRAEQQDHRRGGNVGRRAAS